MKLSDLRAIRDWCIGRFQPKGEYGEFTSEEKEKLKGIEEGANKTEVDSSFSNSSQNPVQNKIITDKLSTIDSLLEQLQSQKATIEQLTQNLTNAKAYADGTYQQSTGYTDLQIANLIGGAPTTLDTLKEIADAMAENASVVQSLDAAIGSKADGTEFSTHANNSTIHITASERNAWDSVYRLDGSTLSSQTGLLSSLATGVYQYWGTYPSDAPFSIPFIVHVSNAYNFRLQVATPYNGSTIKFRARGGGENEWSAWKDLLAVADRLALRRLTGSDSIITETYRVSVDELPPNHASAPATGHWYHNLTMNSADAMYATQLALGMTTNRAYFRSKQANVWQSWLRIATESDITSLKTSFQAGCDTLYNKCISCGVTPAASTPAGIASAIQSIYANSIQTGLGKIKSAVFQVSTKWTLYQAWEVDITGFITPAKFKKVLGYMVYNGSVGCAAMVSDVGYTICREEDAYDLAHTIKYTYVSWHPSSGIVNTGEVSEVILYTHGDSDVAEHALFRITSSAGARYVTLKGPNWRGQTGTSTKTVILFYEEY